MATITSNIGPIIITSIQAPWGFITVGCFISLILYGIILAQAFTYFQNSGKDALWMKTYVASLLLTDTLSTALTMAWIYSLLIDGWGNQDYFLSAGWLLASDPILLGMLSCMVQLFFAWRLHILARKHWLTLFVVACAVSGLLGGIGTGIAVIWLKYYEDFEKMKSIACIWQVSCICADVMITISMTYYLRQAKGGFKSTDCLLDRIIQLTMGNGAVTSLFATVDFLLYLLVEQPYHIGFTFIMTKLYANSVLSSLNAREWLQPLTNDTVELERSHIESGTFATNSTSQTLRQRPEVFVEIQKAVDRDSKHHISDADSETQPEWK